MNDVRIFGYCCKDSMLTFCWFASKKSPPFVRTGNVIRWTSLTQRSLAHILLIEKNTCTTYKISCYLQGYSFTSQVVRRISEPSIDFFQLPSFFTAELPPDNLTCLGTQQMQRKAVDTDGGLFDIVNGNRSSVPPASWNFQTRKCSGNTAELFPGFLFLNTNNPKNRKKKRQTSGQKHLQNLVNWIYQTCVSLSHITKLLHFRHPIFGGMWIPFTGIHRQHHLYIYICLCKVKNLRYSIQLPHNLYEFVSLGVVSTILDLWFWYVPGSKLLIFGIVIPPLLGNPYNGYVEAYYKVDDHPLP